MATILEMIVCIFSRLFLINNNSVDAVNLNFPSP